MKHQAIRPVALMLSVLLIAAVPAQAGTISFGDVIALATVNGQSGRQTIDLRLRSVTQQSGGATGSRDRQISSAGNNSQNPATVQTPTGTAPTGSADTGVTGTTVAVQQPGSVQVETIELGDIQGTICDCGEIAPLPGGGFPKLPFLALAGIPLLFLGGGNDIPPTEVLPPPPTPVPPQVPEPATLLLLGSGLAALGAGARRRRRAASSGEQRDEVLDVREA
ncbi:MAG TPA: PEP-CTERM sorting domain-containing protein [Pyrinomonadaceae bacterium]|nr:PEP-CTERM sorting domain-containing protein [Pyrinomonadaceae bacterium]